MDKKKTDIKKILNKIWYFIWEDDSLLSWVANVIIAFILIKFLVFPGLGLILGGTSHPVVAVVSGSMEHKTVHPCSVYATDNNGNRYCKVLSEEYEICGVRFEEKQKSNFDFFWDTCGDFYRSMQINKLQFMEFPFKNGFNTGDIMVLFKAKPEKIKRGDVIVFIANQPDPIIHRVIETKENNGMYYFTTKGDHNSDSSSWETDIHEDRYIGKAVLRIPVLGYIKIGFVELLKLLNLQNSVGRLF